MRYLLLLLTLAACDVAVPDVDLSLDAPVRYARLQVQSAEGLADEVIVALYNADGLAGGAANDTTLTLVPGRRYDARLIFFSSIPPRFDANLTQAIVDRGAVFAATLTSSDDDLTLVPTDRDANGRPIGLNLRIVVAQDAAGADALRLRLVRYATTDKREPPAEVLVDVEMDVAYRAN